MVGGITMEGTQEREHGETESQSQEPDSLLYHFQIVRIVELHSLRVGLSGDQIIIQYCHLMKTQHPTQRSKILVYDPLETNLTTAIANP